MRALYICGFRLLVVLAIIVTAAFCFRDDDYNELEEKVSSDEALIRKYWGIQDVTTSAGKLFHYKIPSDAFSGKITRYQVEGADGGQKLPNWLVYNPTTATLDGVPSFEDVGDTVINVRAYDTKQHFVGDVFTIEVFPLFEKNINNKKKCKKGDDVVMISIVIDKNMKDISAAQRVDALKNLAHFLGIDSNLFVLLPQQFNMDLLSEALLIAGHGNIKHSTSNTSTVLTWQIGCNEKIWPEKLRLVDLVKQYARDGTLSEVLQLPVVEWRIISSENPFSRGRRHTNGEKKNSTLLSDDGEIEDDDYDDSFTGELDAAVEDNKSESHSHQVRNTAQTNSTSVNKQKQKSDPSSRDVFDSLVSSTEPKKEGEQLEDNDENDENDDDSDDASSTQLPDEIIGPSVYNTSDAFKSSNPASDFASSTISSSSISTASSTLSLVVPVTSSATAVPSKVTTSPVTKSTSATSDIQNGPIVNRELPTFTIVAGKALRFLIPEETFFDNKDGNTRNLTLILHRSDDSLMQWIQLNPVTQELFILPTENDISNWEFELEARNSRGLSVKTPPSRINVQNPKDTRTVNFEISLHLTFKNGTNVSTRACDNNITANSKSTVCYDNRVEWQYKLLRGIASIFSDADTNNITVRSVQYDPFILTWTNDTLLHDTCDKNLVDFIISTLTEPSFSIDPKPSVKEKLNPDVIIDKVSWTGKEGCDVPLPHPGVKPGEKFSPIPRNPIPVLNVTVGELYIYKIPHDTFFDADSRGFNTNSTMTLKTKLNTDIPKDNWLQFDSIEQEIYALPLTTDYNITEFSLIYKNLHGYEISAVVVVDIKEASKTMYNVEFSMVLDMSYDNFTTSLYLQRMFIEKLAQLFNSAGNTSSIVISGYSPGSVYVTWHNKSLSVDKCLETEILKIRQVLLTDDEKPEEKVFEIMNPFPVISINVTPIGICESGLTEFHHVPDNEPSQEIHAIIYYDKYFVVYIIPIVVIVLMLFIAGLIACFLHKRQRRGKLSLVDDERRSLRKKNVPVIFQDELEEQLHRTNKTPIIMKQEKPALPPPEYQKMVPLPTTTLLSDYDDQHLHRAYPSTNSSSFKSINSASSERNSRKQSPNYRKPPPYIPP